MSAHEDGADGAILSGVANESGVVYVGSAARGVGEVTRAPTRRVNQAVDGVSDVRMVLSCELRAHVDTLLHCVHRCVTLPHHMIGNHHVLNVCVQTDVSVLSCQSSARWWLLCHSQLTFAQCEMYARDQ